MQQLPIIVHCDVGKVSLSGDLDGDDADGLKDTLDRYSDQNRADLLVNLSEVTFLPSLIVSVLVRSRIAAAANGAVLRLQVRQDTLPHRVLDVCGIPFELGPDEPPTATEPG